MGTSDPAPAFAASFWYQPSVVSTAESTIRLQAGQGAGKVGFRAHGKIALAQHFAQQADAAAHAKSPQAVQPQGRVRPDAPHPARIFLCCHFHIVSPPGIAFP